MTPPAEDIDNSRARSFLLFLPELPSDNVVVDPRLSAVLIVGKGLETEVRKSVARRLPWVGKEVAEKALTVVRMASWSYAWRSQLR